MESISSLTGTAFSNFTQDTFMKLFVEQLKHQDPMEPMDNNEFTSQLAQMGQLEQLTNMTSAFEKVMRVQEYGNAINLLGAEVTYFPEEGGFAATGIVTGARLDEGEVKLVVGEHLVSLSQVTEINKAAQPEG